MAKKKCYYKDCFDANTRWDDADLVKFNGKNYCYHHYPIVLKEHNDRQKLISYIKQYMRVPYPSGMVLGQIKKFHDNYNYTYEGIIDALELIKVTPSVVIDNNRGIGIVPWYYDKAQDLKNKRQTENSDDEVRQKVYVSNSMLEKTKKAEKFDFSEW